MLNNWDKALHDKIHQSMLEEDPSILQYNHRLRIIDIISNKFKIEGIVADIGCGNGYFGIGLAKKFPNLERIDCIEASIPAVDEVIPRNINFYNVESIVKPVHGTFDDLGSEKYNMIFSMGALHHSKNLTKTLESIAKALKPGGLFIAQEPAMPDETTHADYYFKYNIVEERYDLKIRNGDRFDRFFRECEYKYSLIHNGFDIRIWDEYLEKGTLKARLYKYYKLIKNYLATNGYKKTFLKIITSLNKKKKNISSQQETWKINMSKAMTRVKHKFIVVKKTDCKEIFHG